MPALAHIAVHSRTKPTLKNFHGEQCGNVHTEGLCNRDTSNRACKEGKGIKCDVPIQNMESIFQPSDERDKRVHGLI